MRRKTLDIEHALEHDAGDWSGNGDATGWHGPYHKSPVTLDWHGELASGFVVLAKEAQNTWTICCPPGDCDAPCVSILKAFRKWASSNYHAAVGRATGRP